MQEINLECLRRALECHGHQDAPSVVERAKIFRNFVTEDAVRQLWPLMGFALRDKLAAS